MDPKVRDAKIDLIIDDMRTLDVEGLQRVRSAGAAFIGRLIPADKLADALLIKNPNLDPDPPFLHLERGPIELAITEECDLDIPALIRERNARKVQRWARGCSQQKFSRALTRGALWLLGSSAFAVLLALFIRLLIWSVTVTK